jgi:hypothetical protein
VLPISDQKRTMTTADITTLTRSAAATMVQRRERDSGSRMAAYEQVASMVGVSSSWLRKFIGRSPDAKPSLVTGFNILALYDRMCSRVETEIANERAKIAALRDQIHAAIPSTARLDNRSLPTQANGEEA